MTGKQIAVMVSRNLGIPQATVFKTLEEFKKLSLHLLDNGEDVTLRGLGRFVMSETAQRTGRDFQTGKSVVIPAGRRLVFKPAKIRNKK